MSRGVFKWRDTQEDIAEYNGGYYQGYKTAVYDTLFMGIVYGAYIIVYVTSVYVLLSKPGFTSSPHRMFMFGMTTFMFTLAFIALVLHTAIEFQDANPNYSPSLYNVCYNIWGTITYLMYILCDAICAWRTVVLWRNDKRVIAVLVFSILGTTAASTCALVINNLTLEKLDLIAIGPTLATNLLSTGLIAFKAWQRRIPVKGYLREGSGFVRVDRAFALLIESGLIYCCFWIYYWISTFGVLPCPGFTAMILVSGLYPTLIIILISKQMSPIDQYSTDFTDSIDSEMQFAQRPLRDSGLPRHMLMIRRDSTNDFGAQIPFLKPSDE